MKDFILVGAGLAASNLAQRLIDAGKSVVIIDNNHSKCSSLVAAGLYNPAILKRFTSVWQAKKQIEELEDFFSKAENKFNSSFLEPKPIYRLFANEQEIKTWHKKRKKEDLIEFLSPEIQEHGNEFLKNNPIGEVYKAGRLNIASYLNAFKKYYKNRFIQEEFDYNKLIVKDDYLEYGNLKAKEIVFCEGYGMKKNPFFKTLPLDGTKGEILIVNAPTLKLDKIIKSSVFILPLENDNYFIGSTYDWDDKEWNTTENAKEQLVANFKKLCTAPFTIVEQRAGIRPTVVDRRPLVGTHPEHKNIHLLNGLGTRGVMLGPILSRYIFEYLIEHKPLDPQINIERFLNKKN